MDVITAVQNKENYEAIVTWFYSQGRLTTDQLVLLTDTIELMSEEIFEHYKALHNLCRQEIQTIRAQYENAHGFDGFMEKQEQKRLAYVMRKACQMGVLLSEKYEDMIRDLD